MQWNVKNAIAIGIALMIGFGSLSAEAKPRKVGAKKNTCSKYYVGYVGYIDFNNGKRDFWGMDIGNMYGQFIVVGSGNGNVTIKGTDGGSYPGSGNLDSLSCTRLQEIER